MHLNYALSSFTFCGALAPILMGMAKNFTLPISCSTVSSEQVLLELMEFDGDKGCGPMKAALARQLIYS